MIAEKTIPSVTSQANTYNATQHGQRFKGRGTHAIVVQRERAWLARILRIGQVDCLIDPPHIRAEQFSRTVTCPIPKEE
jgi:hypothetical protein